jgi:hypothetical protein
VREQFLSTLDLTSLGYGTYADVQSVYFVSDHDGAGWNDTVFSVSVSSGLTIVEVLFDDLEDSDEELGLEAEYPSHASRGMDHTSTPTDLTDSCDSVYNQTSTSLDIEWTNCGAPDDLRLLLSYADPSSCETMEITLDPIGELGVIVGESGSGVTDAGDWGEVDALTINLSE